MRLLHHCLSTLRPSTPQLLSPSARASCRDARVFLLLAAAFMLLLPALAAAVPPSFTEDFSTTAFKDAVNTTADWNTADGELKLFPFVPTLVGSQDTPDLARGVAVSGDLAFVADGSSGLQIMDITDPAAPTLVSSYDTPGTAWGLEVVGDLAFVADFDAGLQILDITDPSVPTLVGRKEVSLLCLVDAVNGLGATADSFELKKETVCGEHLLDADIEAGEAAAIAQRTVTHRLGRKLRTITSFDVSVKPRGLVHKRFWIVRTREARVMVDSTNGGLHPLKLRAA